LTQVSNLENSFHAVIFIAKHVGNSSLAD
jgi:hypothetical protein